MLRLSLLLSALVVVAPFALGCRALQPPPAPEAKCQRLCEARAHRCSEHGCERGCGFILDRLAEHETDHVVECVARHKAACDDALWATCAAQIGVHADGGPPPPPPPEE